MTDTASSATVLTLPAAQAGGFSPPAGARNELLAGCARTSWGHRVPRYLAASKVTANVVRRDGLLRATRRTRDGVRRRAGQQATTHGGIARATTCTITRRLPGGKGPFTPVSQVRVPLAPAW